MSSLTRSFVVVGSLFAALTGGCPGAQVKEGGGGGNVEIVLRRVDVVKAAFDQIQLNVIVAVENGTNDDVDVEAALDLALVGPGSVEDEGDAAPAEATDDETKSPVEAAEEATAPQETASGLDGARHKGTGRGTAKANNTSELPISITLPLPADAEMLEQVLSWKRATVHIKGTVKAGFTERTVAGERDLATPQLPELKLKSAQIAKVDDGAAGEAFFTLLLDNKNPFEVVVDRVTWKISIKDKELRTKDDGSTSVPASAVEEYTEAVPVDDKNFPTKDLKAMLKSPSVPYLITASYEVRGIKKDVEFKGEMSFPR